MTGMPPVLITRFPLWKLGKKQVLFEFPRLKLEKSLEKRLLNERTKLKIYGVDVN